VPVFAHKVHLFQFNLESRGDRARVPLVLLELAHTARLLRLVPVAHQHAGHVEPGGFQEPRGHRGVDAAGDADGDARGS
jgi:hypothetical protein